MNSTTKLVRNAVWCISMFAVACGGVPSDGDDASFDAEATQELRRGAPRYDLRSDAIFGEYTSDESCAGGFSACDRVEVTRSGDRVVVRFGDPQYDDYVTDAWAKNGVVLFSLDGLDRDCDDPGCGILRKMSGLIYPVKSGNHWVPQVKVTYVADFPYPDEPTAPEGEVKSVVHMKKSR